MGELDGTRRKIIKVLKPLQAIPVENKVKAGTPDVNYIDGWIELKWLRRWPVRADTIVRIEHFTKIQRRFARDYWLKQGRCWCLLQVGPSWLLFTGTIAHDYVGHVPRRDLEKLAVAHWHRGLKPKELMTWLTKPWVTLNDLQTEKLNSYIEGD